MRRSLRSWPELVLLGATLACTTGGPGDRGTGGESAVPTPVPRSRGTPQQQDPSLPPAGFGSLRQEQVGITLATQSLRIRVIPLDEHVIRLLSPDAYRSLREMRESRAVELAAAARAGGQDSAKAFMVTFFGMQPQTRFNPDDLLISSQNATYRPIGRVAITPRFNENQVDIREQAAAIYLYEPGIAILRPFTVLYGGAQSDAWSQALTLLNAERTRVLSRARPANQP